MDNTAEEKKEAEGIRYLKENNNMTDPAIVLKVYNRLIENKIFTTKVGIAYLKELYEFLISNNIDKSMLKPIPIIAEEAVEEAVSEAVEPKRENVQPPKIQVVDAYKNPVKAPAKKTERKEVQNVTGKKTYKEQFVTSLILNIVLVIIVIVMFFITLSKDNPTILNYEEKLQDKYASWAEELKEKEKELNEREYNMNNSDSNDNNSESTTAHE